MKNIIDAEINKLIKHFYKYPHCFLTEEDVRCYLVEKLMKHKEWLIIKKYLIGKNKPKGHHLCVVCMTDKIRKCHRKVFRALFKLHERIKAFNLNNYLQNNSSGTASDNFILNKLRISDKSNV